MEGKQEERKKKMTKKRWSVKVVKTEPEVTQGKAPYRSGFQHPKALGKSEVKSVHKERRL